jgi:DNA excision repair protein ERCC-4
MRRRREPSPAFGAVVVVDTREQHPYEFAAITADRCEGDGFLKIERQRATLSTGDYSLQGFETEIAVERKSLADLYHTLGQGRERFERELARLNDMKSARVVVEAEWSEIINAPPARSKLSPKSVYRSIIAWMERYPRVHWLPVPGRQFAEVTTFRVLQRFLRERERNSQCPQSS